jgi:hypothetical protein
MAKAIKNTENKSVMTEANLRKIGDKIVSNVETIGADIQTYLLSAREFVIRTRNVTPLGDFLIKLARLSESKSHSIVRSDAVKAWAKEFAFTTIRPIKDKEGKLVVKLYLDKDRLDNMTSPELAEHGRKAEKTKWMEFKADPTWKAFDLGERLASIIKQANERSTEDVPAGKSHNIPADLMEYLKNAPGLSLN